MKTPTPFTLVVNGAPITREARPDDLLIDFLHEAGKTGTKFGCGIGQCGACKVAVQEREDGELIPVLACFARLNAVEGMRVTTVEGLAQGEQLHPLQQELLDRYAFQCGYSTPGMLMAGHILIDRLERHGGVARGLLDRKVAEAMSGHVCRCTGYVRYFDAIKRVIEGWHRSPRSKGKPLVHARPPEPDGQPPPSIWFQVIKQSRYDLEEKRLEGRFEAPEGELKLRRPREWSTCTGELRVQVDRIRTGEPIRDLNLRKFLFGSIRTISFLLEDAEPLGGGVGDGDFLPGFTAPLRLEGTLRVGNASVKAASDALLTVLSEDQMAVRTRQPIRVPLASLQLPVESFAREFGLKLGDHIELGVDNAIVTYTLA